MFYKKIIIVLLSLFLVVTNNKVSVASEFPEVDGGRNRRLLTAGLFITGGAIAFLGYKCYDNEVKGWRIPGVITISRESPFIRFGSTPGLNSGNENETRKQQKSKAPPTPEEARSEAIEKARKAGADLATEIELQAKAAQNFVDGLIELYESGIIVDSEIDLETIKSNRTERYSLLIESLKRLGHLHTELTTAVHVSRSPARRFSSSLELTPPRNQIKLFEDLQATEEDDTVIKAMKKINFEVVPFV